jgi:flagellum-specific peptidoglycan hydrolase FlgJ
MQERYPDLEKEYQENLAIALAAQCKLETGFVSCYNFNTGNYHAVGSANKNWKGKVFAMSDPQGYGANTYVNLDKFFRAYDNVYDGLSDQFSLLERKMSKAVEAAKIGDAYNFGMELGRAGYYTANKDRYSTSVKKIFDNMKAKQTQNLV